ncbi:MAG: hypothetical protein EHJ95_07620 [Methanobacteriota archaeon]|nr:MAG: hypothetical protein EHJ95_07620 [Euryarchaeota archaeon]
MTERAVGGNGLDLKAGLDLQIVAVLEHAPDQRASDNSAVHPRCGDGVHGRNRSRPCHFVVYRAIHHFF